MNDDDSRLFKYEKNFSAIRNDLFSMEEKGSGAYQIVTNMNNNEFCESVFSTS